MNIATKFVKYHVMIVGYSPGVSLYNFICVYCRDRLWCVYKTQKLSRYQLDHSLHIYKVCSYPLAAVLKQSKMHNDIIVCLMVWYYTLFTMTTSHCRAERQSAADGNGPTVNKLLSAYHNDNNEDKELTPAVQELCATIDAYIFVIDSSRALIEGWYICIHL